MTTEITNILKGFKEFSETSYENSIRFLKEYIEVEPSSEAFFELGKALFLNGKYDESISYLKKSGDSRTDAYLGLDHYMKGDYENAIIHFKKFLKHGEENESILSYLMLSYEKCREWRDAMICGEKLLDINPDNTSIKRHMVDFHFNLKEYKMSLAYINELDDMNLRYEKGMILFHLKRYKEAIDELKHVMTPEHMI